MPYCFSSLDFQSENRRLLLLHQRRRFLKLVLAWHLHRDVNQHGVLVAQVVRLHTALGPGLTTAPVYPSHCHTRHRWIVYVVQLHIARIVVGVIFPYDIHAACLKVLLLEDRLYPVAVHAGIPVDVASIISSNKSQHLYDIHRKCLKTIWNFSMCENYFVYNSTRTGC